MAEAIAVEEVQEVSMEDMEDMSVAAGVGEKAVVAEMGCTSNSSLRR